MLACVGIGEGADLNCSAYTSIGILSFLPARVFPRLRTACNEIIIRLEEPIA